MKRKKKEEPIYIDGRIHFSCGELIVTLPSPRCKSKKKGD